MLQGCFCFWAHAYCFITLMFIVMTRENGDGYDDVKLLGSALLFMLPSSATQHQISETRSGFALPVSSFI